IAARVGGSVRRILSFPRRTGRARRGRRRGGDPARRQRARRRGDRGGRRARHRHGVHRRAPLQALMKLLVVGSGGREHALAWKIAQSPRVQKVFVAPGNGGTASETGVENVPIAETPALIEFCRREAIALTVVGPEAPLASGIVDAFREAGLRIFGPSRAAAQLESSKHFAKRFMARHGIPTAGYATFNTAPEARAHVAARGAPIVIKADGLAAGKGVVV